jgi:replicative DNA helicase
MQKLTEVFKKLESNKKNLEFLKTGIALIDDFMDGGFLRKELVVLGGHSGSGKSYVAGTFFYNVAHQGFKCAYFSLEISNEMVVSRLIGAISNIKPIRVMVGELNESEIDIKTKAKAEIYVHEPLMSFYDDIYELEKIYQEIKSNGYEFIVVDFIQNVIAQGNDEYSRLSHIALELQRIAKELNCCILVLSQLSNAAAREKQDTQFLEYKGSGSIATVCDIGMVIARGEDLGGSNDLLLSIRKNRRGISGKTLQCAFIQPGGRIV